MTREQLISEIHLRTIGDIVRLVESGDIKALSTWMKAVFRWENFTYQELKETHATLTNQALLELESCCDEHPYTQDKDCASLRELL